MRQPKYVPIDKATMKPGYYLYQSYMNHMDYDELTLAIVYPDQYMEYFYTSGSAFVPSNHSYNLLFVLDELTYIGPL